MKFTKVHSLGNDFIVIDEDDNTIISEKEALVRQICKRHTGIGGDGLLFLSTRNENKDIFDLRIFNADGTEPVMSGSGLRCASAFIYSQKKTNSNHIILNTTIGSRECEVIDRKNNWFQIKIEMGTPQFSSQEIPFDDGSFHEKVIDYPLIINKKTFHITLVSLGNPHCVMFFERFPARIEWQPLAYEIEFHPFFPKKTNIEFTRILSKKEIEVMFWERGVGETLSSGSGSCAAAVASILKELTENKVSVKTSMGTTAVEWGKGKVHQTGSAQIVFNGEFLSI